MKKVLYLSVLIAALGCTKYKDNSSGNNNTNDDPTICTNDSPAIYVTVKDKDGNPIKLDKISVIFTTTNKDITNTLSQDSNNGLYTVLNDSYKQELRNKNYEILFVGYKNSIKVIEEKYTATADQCHIRYVSGKREIVL